ncbi:MAG: NAD-dependent succinate-semialdehyde dehydrogenase, partial [Candidatus Dormibacteria bacterium]
MATQVRETETINPATGETIERFSPPSEAAVETIIAGSDRAYRSWRTTSFSERARLMSAAAAELRSRRDHYAASITREMGKPITEAEAEVEKCALGCDYYAEHAERFLGDEPAPSDSPHSFVAYEPIGPVLAVMPWNFPLWQVFRFAAPALMAGNVGLLKHSTNVSRCALDIEDVFRRAGFPDDVFRTLLIPASTVAGVIADPRVRAVTLTGSDATGSQVAATAGEHLKKTVLELGGSDAFIVLQDADIAQAAEVAAKSRFQNAGQSCIAAKRFLVVEGVAEEFEQRLAEQATSLRVGEPMRRDTQMGPLARDDLRDDLEDQLKRSVSHGARVVAGGHRREGRGYFFEPTVLTGCTADSAAMREETFGPLAAVARVRDAEEALRVANDSDFGLGGNIWTADVERGVALARRMDTGGV